MPDTTPPVTVPAPAARLAQLIVPLVSVGMLVVAGLALRHLLREYRLADVLDEIQRLTPSQIALAMAVTLVAYFVLTFYDVIGLIHLRRTVSYPRVALISFSSYAFSHNFGFPPLTALPLRMRLYAPTGLSVMDVTDLFAFTSVTFGIGFLAVGGLSFAIEPLTIPDLLRLPKVSLHPIGWILLAALGTYVLLCGRLTRPLTLRGHAFALPSRRIAILQTIIASLDWLLAAGVLYVLLPEHGDISYFRFVGMFALAFGAGTVSHVPGGLGVFEAVIIFFLSPMMPGDAVAGSLLAFRMVYNVLPLIVALAALGIYEACNRRGAEASKEE